MKRESIKQPFLDWCSKNKKHYINRADLDEFRVCQNAYHETSIPYMLSMLEKEGKVKVVYSPRRFGLTRRIKYGTKNTKIEAVFVGKPNQKEKTWINLVSYLQRSLHTIGLPSPHKVSYEYDERFFRYGELRIHEDLSVTTSDGDLVAKFRNVTLLKMFISALRQGMREIFN